MGDDAFDLVIHGGTVVTASETFRGDLGIREGRIAAVAERIVGGSVRIDAGGRLVMPGGIETHCHIAQESSSGVMTADDYRSGSVSAAFGGNSCFVPFAAQQRGQTIDEVIATYDARAAGRSVIDYSYHLIVSDPTPEGAAIVQRERLAGTKLFAETCPQYLALTRDALDRPGQEGAKFVCSPPLRDEATWEALWRHVATGTFDAVSSDYAPYRADASGKFLRGADAPYPAIANGMPGIAMRLPYLFSEGVAAGRLTLQQFVRLSASNAARVFGLRAKGALAPGFDADVAIWDPEARWRATLADQHDAMDYTPFEGLEITGRPVAVLSRGVPVVRDGALVGAPGHGRFVARRPVDLAGIPGHRAAELDSARNFGADVAP